MVEWVPQCFGDRRRARRSPRSAPPSRRPAPTSARCAPGPSTTRPPTSGCSTGRRRTPPTAASPTCTWSPPPSTPTLGSRGQAAFVVPPGTPGLAAHPKLQEARPARLAHRRRLPRRRPGARPLPARRPGRARRAAGPGPLRAAGHRPGRDAHLRAVPADGRRAGARASPGPPTSTPSTTPRTRVQFGRPIIENQAIAFALADMRMEIDAARLLVWRAAWMGRNNRPFTAGEGSMSKLKAGEVAVVGDREGGADPRRGRLPARPPGRALVPRRQDLHHLRGHLARSSGWSSPGPSPASRSADRRCRSTARSPVVHDGRRRLGGRPATTHDRERSPW